MDHVWGSLKSEIREEFEKKSVPIRLRRGEFVYRQGDHPKGMYFILNGLVGLTLLSPKSGKEHLLRFFKAGQFFGHRALFAMEAYHGSAVAIEATELKLVPSSAILAAVKSHPEILMNVVKVLSKELRRCENQHVLILENEILARVAHSLIYLKDLHPEHPWTRQEIANFCASTTSTVIKAMASLEDLGLIKQVGRNISILNRNGLLQLDEDDA